MSSEGTELSGGQPFRLEDRARALALDEALQHLHAALLVEDGKARVPPVAIVIVLRCELRLETFDFFPRANRAEDQPTRGGAALAALE